MKKETKKSRLERCRALIDRQKFDQLWSEADLDEFYEITWVPALAAVRTANLKWSGDLRHIRVQVIEGLWEGISWRVCIEGCNMARELKIILRGEIEGDLKDFLDAIEPKRCATNGTHPKCTPFLNLCADHVGKSFDEIADAFIAEYGPIAVCEGPSGGSDIITNRELAAKWIQFHASHAVYQVLCRPCNSSKGRKAKPWEKASDQAVAITLQEELLQMQ